MANGYVGNYNVKAYTEQAAEALRQAAVLTNRAKTMLENAMREINDVQNNTNLHADINAIVLGDWQGIHSPLAHRASEIDTIVEKILFRPEE